MGPVATTAATKAVTSTTRSTQDFQEIAQKPNTTCAKDSKEEAVNSVASAVLKNGSNASEVSGIDFLEQYLEATTRGIKPSREQQDMALRDLEARLAATTLDPQELLHDRELAAAEKSVEIKPGTQRAIYAQSHQDMVKHFALGKNAIILAEILGATVDPDKKVIPLKWPTQKPYLANAPGSVKQLDDIMTCGVKSLMLQLKIPVPSTDTWEGLKPELHKLLRLNPPFFPDQTTLQNYNLPRLFSVYDDGLPKWLVALALTSVRQETDLQKLFPNAQEALNTKGIKCIKPEAYELIKGMNEKSSIPMLMSFIELVLSPNLEIAAVLLK